MNQTKLTKEFTVRNLLGIHARPASIFVQTASDFVSDINVTNLETKLSVDGKSVMSMLMLAAPKGTRIRLDISGSDAEPAMQALSDLIEGGFRE